MTDRDMQEECNWVNEIKEVLFVKDKLEFKGRLHSIDPNKKLTKKQLHMALSQQFPEFKDGKLMSFNSWDELRDKVNDMKEKGERPPVVISVYPEDTLDEDLG